jgi:single-strand DNA-binding protein
MILTQIAGHLGADPETRVTPSGQKIVTLRVATNIRRKDKDKTVWWRVTIFGDRYDRMLPYLKKGSAVFIIGSMNAPEIYQDKEGNPQISLELIAEFLSFSPFGGKSDKSNDGAGASQDADSSSNQSYGAPKSQFQPQNQFQPRSFGMSGIQSGAAKEQPEFSDDDIPF